MIKHENYNNDFYLFYDIRDRRVSHIIYYLDFYAISNHFAFMTFSYFDVIIH